MDGSPLTALYRQFQPRTVGRQLCEAAGVVLAVTVANGKALAVPDTQALICSISFAFK
jgi:hypothetical protein